MGDEIYWIPPKLLIYIIRNYIMTAWFCFWGEITLTLPIQECSSWAESTYPWRQVHVYESRLSVHVWSQPPLEASHSFVAAERIQTEVNSIWRTCLASGKIKGMLWPCK